MSAPFFASGRWWVQARDGTILPWTPGSAPASVWDAGVVIDPDGPQPGRVWDEDEMLREVGLA